MIVLGIDPGNKSPGFALTDSEVQYKRGRKGFRAPEVFWVGVAVSELICDPNVAVVESQWFNPKIKQTSIYKLAFNAGWYLRGANTNEKYTTSVDTWKHAIIKGQLSKAVFCNRLYAMLTTNEQALVDRHPRAVRSDLLDAIGISWSWYLSPDGLERVTI